MVHESLKAAAALKKDGISAEVIDLRSAKPLDAALLYESVRKTGRLVVADGGWRTCGLAAEVSSLVSEHAHEYLKAPVMRVTLPDIPAPASKVLEQAYYPTSDSIVRASKGLFKKKI
jgi:pyruvate dehydrogenase E1 component beta subunit